MNRVWVKLSSLVGHSMVSIKIHGAVANSILLVYHRLSSPFFRWLSLYYTYQDFTKQPIHFQVRVVRRDSSAKKDIPMTNLVDQVKELLDTIQQNLFDTAKEKRDACIRVVRTWEEFVEALGQKKLIFAPWCDEEEVEKDVKARTKGDMGAAKTLCTPFDRPEMEEGTVCFASGKPATKWTYWGRSY